MGFQILFGQNALDGGLDRPTQSGVSRLVRMRTHIRRQHLMRPNLRRQAQVDRLRAGQGHDPRLGFRSDHRILGAMVEVLQSGFPSHGQGLVDAFIDSGATHSHRPGNGLKRETVGIGQKNAGSLHFPDRSRSGSGYTLEALSLFGSQNQGIPFGFVGHPPLRGYRVMAKYKPKPNYCKHFNGSFY